MLLQSRRQSKNVVALTIGLLQDYTADMGVAIRRGALYARMRLVNTAKALGVQAIDSVFGDVSDMASLRRWAENSRALGFEGMGCIHPGQIPVIHEAFAPSASEVEKATRIVAAFEEAQQRGLGVVSLGSKMIDPPVVERAQRLVERAKRMEEFRFFASFQTASPAGQRRRTRVSAPHLRSPDHSVHSRQRVALVRLA